MIDFACKNFNLDEIIKCSLSLTKSEFKIFNFLLKNNSFFNSSSLSSSLSLDLTTTQRAMKKLYESSILIRSQNNLDKGGYEYTYKIKNKKELVNIISKIIQNWTDKVKEELNIW
jgi:predicted transcriptional regulator